MNLFTRYPHARCRRFARDATRYGFDYERWNPPIHFFYFVNGHILILNAHARSRRLIDRLPSWIISWPDTLLWTFGLPVFVGFISDVIIIYFPVVFYGRCYNHRPFYTVGRFFTRYEPVCVSPMVRFCSYVCFIFIGLYRVVGRDRYRRGKLTPTVNVVMKK